MLVGAAIAALPLSGAERELGTGFQLENVEILDPGMGLPAARRYMKSFNEALGVRCRDCHILRDFASDYVPLKVVAREMMGMTREINDLWFPGEEEVITCFTCHQGRRIPPRSLMPESADSTAGGGEGTEEVHTP